MPEFSDLLRRARAGERAALSALYDGFRDCVERAARNGIGPGLHRHVDTLDIAQSVFGDLLRELPRIEDRGEAAFRGWLLTKVRNKLCTKARRQALRDGGHGEGRLATAVGDAIATPHPPPDEAAAERDAAARLGRLLGSLAPEQREVVGLHVDEGLSWTDVAARAGLPSAAAARMRYVRALEVLRARWTPD